ncbi:MAG: saccharopine dehydrogenase C-terminal domain-containing protein, partial [Bacteroidota bacterium]|nr:saccharopine dehydrogenase C-terminal domain-containing protein [Bacteroidota bacterium]
EMKALDKEAREKGVILLNEMGLDPGIDHMSSMRIIDQIHGKGGAVLEFYSLCGARPAPEAAGNPFKYKFSWSPKGVILAGNNDAMYLRHGKVVDIPTHDLFKNPIRIDFPEVGPFEVYPNRDSISYKEVYGIPEAQTMFRGTIRFQGWCETLDVMKQLCLISYDKFDMTGMTFADMMCHQLAAIGYKVKENNKGPEGIRSMIADALHIPENVYALDALQWLGLFDRKPMNRGTDSTFEVVSDEMIAKMQLGLEERDMVVLQHVCLASYPDGKKEVIRSRMLDFGTLATDTSIARTVGLPAAIGVDMILTGKINLTGVHIPVIPEIYEPVLNQLETLNIKMEEEFGLPMSELIL